MTEPTLFPMDVPEPPPQLGQAALLTLRQARLLRARVHPATKLPLHAEAADPDDRKAEGLRCRTCSHLVKKRQGNGEWLKCDLSGDLSGPDARAWWPACNEYAGQLP